MSRPDEGMIHAWLDGELDVAEAARVEALVRDNAEWAAAAAEARGFIAASARIVGALDHVPANVIPQSVPEVTPLETARNAGRGAMSGAGTRRTPWWTMRVAALLVVAVGAAIVLDRSTADLGAPVSELKKDDAPVSELKKVDAPGPTAAPVAPPAVPPAVPLAVPLAAKSASPSSPVVGGGATSTKARDLASGATRARAGAPVGNAPAAESARRDAAAEIRARSALAASPLQQVVTTGAADAPPRSSGAAAAPPPLPAASAALDEAQRREQSADATMREECYREATGGAAGGGTAAVIRVIRTSDSTAVSMAIPPAPAGANALRAPAALPRQMTVRGDTLVIAVVGDVRRIAVRVSCGAP